MKFAIGSLIVACVFASACAYSFYPAHVPCSYTEKREVTTKVTTGDSEPVITQHMNVTIQVYGFFLKQLLEFFVPEWPSQILLYRPDMSMNYPEEGEKIAEFSHYASKCDINYIDRRAAEDSVMAARSFYIRKIEASDMTRSVEFNGFTCDAYIQKDEEHNTTTTFYVDENNNIIGQVVLAFDQESSTETTTIFSVSNSSDLESFALDSALSPGCEDPAVYSPPAAGFECVGYIYRPELQCANSIMMVELDASTGSGFTLAVANNGPLSKITSSQLNSTIVRRADLMDEDGNIPVFTYNDDLKTCNMTYMKEDEVRTAIKNDFSFFTQERKFQYGMGGDFSTGLAHGDLVFVNPGEDANSTESLLIDTETNMIVLYSYMGKTQMWFQPGNDRNMYVFDKDDMVGCDNAAYTAPEVDYNPCGIPFDPANSSSSSSSSKSSSHYNSATSTTGSSSTVTSSSDNVSVAVSNAVSLVALVFVVLGSFLSF